MKLFGRKDAEGMFREEREGRLNKTKSSIYGLFIGFFVVAIVWFFLYSGIFSIKDIEIGELRVLRVEAVRGEIEGYFNQPKRWPWGNRNIFFLDEEDLKKFVAEKFFVDNLTVEKVYPNILRLMIKERQRSVVLVTKNNFYIVDDYGVITDIADEATASTTRRFLISPSPVETSKEIYVISSATTTYSKGTSYTGSGRVRQWLDTSTKLREAGIWFKAIDIGTNPSDSISLILRENKNVLLEMNEVLDAQIENLRQFMMTKPKLEEVKEYIDVRVPGKIYYK